MSYQRWVHAHQLGLKAFALRTLPITGDGLSSLEKLLSLSRELESDFGNGGIRETSRRTLLQSLPLQVLLLVEDCFRDNLRSGKKLASLLAEIEAAREGLTEKPQEYPLWTRLQVWSYHALLASTTSRRLLKLGRVLFGGKNGATWREFERDQSLVESLERNLKVLRSAWRATRERCSAVERVGQDIGKTQVWPQLENVLYHHQFFWPLLVTTLAGSLDNISVSLPVAVEVELDGNNRLKISPEEGPLVLEFWRPSLAKAVSVAKELWRSKHGNNGRFRRQVLSASVQFDFSAAAEVVAPLWQHGVGRIELDGGSAEAYLAEAVLARLLGKTPLFASVCSAAIGDQVTMSDGKPTLNYFLKKVDGVAAKLGYVHASRSFERVVLAQAQELPANAVRNQSAQLLQAKDMVTASDIMQTHGWRQHQYVRCPEIAWAVHSTRDGHVGLSADSPGVRAVLRELECNDSSPVLACDEASGLAVVSALGHLNSTNLLRESPPPFLSWAVVRCVPYEQDQHFWNVIWDVMGAPASEFDKLSALAAPAAAARRIGAALNRFTPSAFWPSHRAPDILILLNLSAIEEEEQKVLNPRSRPLMVGPILRELQVKRLLKPVPHALHQAQLGVTRVVVVHNEPKGLTRGRRPAVHAAGDIEILSTLSVFQFGFTNQMAGMVLNEISSEFCGAARHELLGDLVSRELLREGQGKYHIPPEVAAELPAPYDSQTKARRHFLAGAALAPYTIKKHCPALALDVAFRPEYVHDASWHLNTARSLVDPEDFNLKSAIKDALHRLWRFAEVPCWHVVKDMTRFNLGLDALEMAKELLAAEDAGGKTPHPSHILYVARAARQCAVMTKRANEGLHRDATATADEHYERALKACKNFPEEEDFNRLLVLTDKAAFLHAIYGPERQPEIDRLSREALNFMNTGVSPLAANGEWVELVTDAEADHKSALGIYKWALVDRQTRMALWGKGLGAAILAGNVTVEREILEGLHRSHQKVAVWGLDLRAILGKCWRKQTDDPRSWVKDRWRAGLETLDRHEARVIAFPER